MHQLNFVFLFPKLGESLHQSLDTFVANNLIEGLWTQMCSYTIYFYHMKQLFYNYLTIVEIHKLILMTVCLRANYLTL